MPFLLYVFVCFVLKFLFAGNDKRSQQFQLDINVIEYLRVYQTLTDTSTHIFIALN